MQTVVCGVGLENGAPVHTELPVCQGADQPFENCLPCVWCSYWRIGLGLRDPGWGETEFSGRSLGVSLCFMRTCKDDVKLD